MKLLIGALIFISSAFSFYAGYQKGFSDSIYIHSPGDAYAYLRDIKFIKSGASDTLISEYEIRAKNDLDNWRIFKAEKIEFISKILLPEVVINQKLYIDKIKKMEQDESTKMNGSDSIDSQN